MSECKNIVLQFVDKVFPGGDPVEMIQSGEVNVSDIIEKFCNELIEIVNTKIVRMIDNQDINFDYTNLTDMTDDDIGKYIIVKNKLNKELVGYYKGDFGDTILIKSLKSPSQKEIFKIDIKNILIQQ